MRENCTSGLMSGEGKWSAKAPPRLSSTLLKRQKNDATDAEAICEAVTCANMRVVQTKTPSSRAA
jgi:transposase